MNLFANDIITQECATHDVSRDAIFSSRRGEGLPAIRVIIIKRMWRELNLGPAAIGRLLNRDHSTICHHLKAIKKQNTSPTPSPLGLAKTTAAGFPHPDTRPGRRHPIQNVIHAISDARAA